MASKAAPPGQANIKANVKTNARTGTPQSATPQSATPQSATPQAATPRGPRKASATVLSSRVAYQGKVFSVTTDEVTEPDGGGTHTRDVIRHNGSVVILAVDQAHESDDAADLKILLIRQYRHAAGHYLLELPAGRIEPGEAPLAAAKRELIEETGFRAKRWSRLVRYYASPGFLAETMQVFLAEDLRPGKAQPEADEHITLQRMPAGEVLRLIGEGNIVDGKTILAVLLHLQNLRAANK